MHKLTAYRELLPDQPPLPVAERAGDEVLSLPLSPAHSDDDIADVVAALRRVHERRTAMKPAASRRPSRSLVTGLCARVHPLEDRPRPHREVIADANLCYFLAALALMLVTILPMAWRWQLLLKTKGVHEEIPWLTRAYFVSYAAGQVLPTSVGGDAVRIFETARRHPGHGNTAAASVLLERAIGGAATLMLAAVGFLLAVGHYDVGPYLWIEALFVVGTIILGFLLFSPPARGRCCGSASRCSPSSGPTGSLAQVYDGDPLLPPPRRRLLTVSRA